MSEPAPAPSPTPEPAPAPAPAAAAAAPAPAAERPAYIPEQFWDPETRAVKAEDFGKHYTELAASAAKLAERTAAVPEKPDGYKLEVKLPETVKLPAGVQFDPAKDPRNPILLPVLHKHGAPQALIDDLIAADAQMKINDHLADQARIADERKKLGETANERIAAAKSWVRAGKFTAGQIAAAERIAEDADGVTFLETCMQLANGAMPGHQPSPDPKPAPKSIAERMYPNLPSGLPPASARSA